MKAWFYLKHPEGRIITSIVRHTDLFAVAEARLYKGASIDEPFFANGFAQKTKHINDDEGGHYLENAMAAAIWKALDTGGFNIITTAKREGNGANVGDEITPEEPGQVGSPDAQSSESKEPIPIDKNKKDKNTEAPTVEELMATMTLEEAKNYKITLKFNQGKTLGQVALDSPAALEWYVNSYSGKDNMLRAAAQMLINAAKRLVG